MARKYTPIWELLKKNQEVKVTAPPIFHARIIKAVTKEKYMDDGWKFMLEEKKNRPTLHHKIIGPVIHFYLAKDSLLNSL